MVLFVVLITSMVKKYFKDETPRRNQARGVSELGSFPLTMRVSGRPQLKIVRFVSYATKLLFLVQVEG